MTRLLLPSRFSSQPQQSFLIYPARVGLKNPFFVGNFTDLAGHNYASPGVNPTKTGTITQVISTVGRGNFFAGNANNDWSYSCTTTAQTQFTACGVFDWTSGATPNQFPRFASTSNQASNTGYSLYSGLSDGGELGLYSGLTSLGRLVLTTAIPYAFVCSHDQPSGDYYFLLRNLQTGLYSSVTATNTASSGAGSGTMYVGGKDTTGSICMNGTWYTLTMAFEYIPRSVAEMWLRDPWAIFQAPRYVFASTTNDITVGLTGIASTAAVGTVVKTGISVSEPIAEIASTTNSATYSFGAFTPKDDSTLVILAFATGTTDAAVITGGLTWTLETSLNYNVTDTAYLFWANTGTSPGSLTFTFDCTGDNATGLVASMFEFRGSDVVRANPIKQYKTASFTLADPTVTFDAAMNTLNGYCAGFGMPRNPPTSAPPTNWFETADAGYNTPASGASTACRTQGETGSTVTFTSSIALYGIIAAEIYAATTDVTLALTNTSAGATGSVGSLTSSSNLAITGESTTASVGNVVSSQELTGISATGAVGSVVLDTTLSSTGVSSTGSVGIVVANLETAITGNSLSGSVGSVNIDNAISIVGLSSTASIDSVGLLNTLGLTNVVVTGDVGTITPNTDSGLSLPLSGIASTLAVDSLVLDTALPLTNVNLAGASGTITISADVTLPITGVQSNAGIGFISIPSLSQGGGKVIKFKKTPPEKYDQSYLDRIFGNDDLELRQVVIKQSTELYKNAVLFEAAIIEIKLALQAAINLSNTNMALAMLAIREKQIIEDIVQQKLVVLRNKRKKEEELMIQLIVGYLF